MAPLVALLRADHALRGLDFLPQAMLAGALFPSRLCLPALHPGARAHRLASSAFACALPAQAAGALCKLGPPARRLTGVHCGGGRG